MSATMQEILSCGQNGYVCKIVFRMIGGYVFCECCASESLLNTALMNLLPTGKLCIEVSPASKIAHISETLCIGCGICAKVKTFQKENTKHF